VQQIRPEGGPNPGGAYVPGIRAGDLVFVSGQGPHDPQTGQLLADDVEGQVRATLANVERVLAAADATLQDVVRIDAYLADLGDFPDYDRAFRDVFAGHLPTRTTVQAGLADILVEINAIAFTGED
jgi:2-iminobutanoate/2-iminopropanoate deaminase